MIDFHQRSRVKLSRQGGQQIAHYIKLKTKYTCNIIVFQVMNYQLVIKLRKILNIEALKIKYSFLATFYTELSFQRRSI